MGTAENSEERQVLCSACLQIVPEYLARVIPYYNCVAEVYVTTYRCEECWLPALAETRARLESTEDGAEIASAVAFFERHGVFLYEFYRGDPLSVVRKMLVRVIDQLQSAAIRLSIGPLEPQG
jgi:hypothetical protein